jgi:tetratricopeptide (TPR) repeat protein
LWLALAYQRLNRLPEANKELTQMMSSYGDTLAYQYAEIYAQWNDIPNALRWLDRAYSLRDSGLSYLKVDRLLQPLRKEPRDQEIERKLGFPT